jgi:predicted Fe-Mo cluster-binding NifX family protein
MEVKVRIAVSSLGTSLDAWAGGAFGTCAQFLVVDSETMDFVVVSVPSEQREPSKVSLAAIRALANQEVEVIITGQIKDICRQAMLNLGIEVVEGVGRITVRDAVSTYANGGPGAIADYKPSAAKIAVASHGNDLDATLSPKREVCTSFVLVDPQTMDFEVIQVEPADSPERASVNAVRAAAKNGATVVITPEIRPACCTALRALAIQVVLADEHMAVREAVKAYGRGELSAASYL